jgi:hypothetical protein
VVRMLPVLSPQAALRCVRDSVPALKPENWRWTVNPQPVQGIIMLGFATAALSAGGSANRSHGVNVPPWASVDRCARK